MKSQSRNHLSVCNSITSRISDREVIFRVEFLTVRPWTRSKNAENSSYRNICGVFIYINSLFQNENVCEMACCIIIQWFSRIYFDHMLWITGTRYLLFILLMPTTHIHNCVHKVFLKIDPWMLKANLMGRMCPLYP